MNHAFNSEDKPIIENQQKMIGQRDLMQLQPVLLPNDGGSGRARRFIELRIAAEEQPAVTTAEAAAVR